MGTSVTLLHLGRGFRLPISNVNLADDIAYRHYKYSSSEYFGMSDLPSYLGLVGSL